MKHIDLRSDTVTHPPPEMKKAMFEAELGDDVFGDDPTVKELEALAAQMLGKEAGLFVPSGCMGNQLALFTHCTQGQEVIIPDDCHTVVYEAGGAAIISKVQLRTLQTDEGKMDLNLVKSKIRRDPNDPHFPSTGLIWVQTPSGPGYVLSLEYLQKLKEIAEADKIPVHMDGARIFNAAAYLGVEAKDIAQYADSVMFCLSKGLCCPVGSMIVGTKEFIEKARRNRKMLGGTMRQVGILAAAGIYALKNLAGRVGEDLKTAKLLAKELSNNMHGLVTVLREPQINMVFFKVNHKSFDHDDFVKYMLEKGIKIIAPSKGTDVWRFATHYYIGEKEAMTVIEHMREYLGKLVSGEQ